MPDVNHLATVERLHAEQPPEHTVDSVFEFALRVLRALPPHEFAGLVRSFPGAENTVLFHGVFVRVGRICYPDGERFKIATDIPTTNAPVWHREADVDPNQYFDVTPFLAPLPPATWTPPPPPATHDLGDPFAELDDELSTLLEAMERIVDGLVNVRDAIVALTAKVNELQSTGVPLRLSLRR